MLTRIIILVLLLTTNGFSQNMIPVEMTRKFAFYGKGTLYVKVKLMEGEKELINKDFNILNDTNTMRMYDTINVSSNSSLRYEINYGATLTKEFIDFNVNGDEVRLVLQGVFSEKNSIKSLSYMTVQKIYNGDNLAELTRDTGNKYNLSNFFIKNLSNEKIYGTGYSNHFWSDLFTYKDDNWINITSLVLMCGNIGEQKPIEKYETARANLLGIAYFLIEEPFKLIPGKFKAINIFSYSPNGDLIPSNNVVKKIFTYYEISTEFEIK